MAKKFLTQRELKTLFHYDPDTGVMVRLVSAGGKLTGEKVGYISGNGRKQVKIDGKSYTLTKLIWLYMTGEWPSKEIDHINRNAIDDRWVNLRLASRSENCRNRTAYNNTGLPKWVYLNHGSFVAKIRKNGKLIHLGTYDTPEEAYNAAKKYAKTFHGEYLSEE